MCNQVASIVCDQTDSIWTIVSASGAFFSAFFAAVAAWLMFSIQRRNELEAACPLITLDGWHRIYRENAGLPDTNDDVFYFNQIKNEGKGIAYRVSVNVTSSTGQFGMEWAEASMSTMAKPIILSGKEFISQGIVSLNWLQTPEYSQGRKAIGFKIRITCFCSKGYFHETNYMFMAYPQNKKPIMVAGNEIALATYFLDYKVRHLPPWKFSLINQLSRFPVIGKKFKPIWI